MFRRFLPAILILVCFLLDTAVIPVITTGIYVVPLMVVCVFCIGMVLGRMRGLLYGTMGGLLLDITTGTLGLMTYFLMFIGFMIGLIVYTPGERITSSRRKQQRWTVWPSVWVFVLYLAGELAMFIIQYFNTAEFKWIYLLNMLIRGLICTAVCFIARPVFDAIFAEKAVARVKKAPKVEVNRF